MTDQLNLRLPEFYVLLHYFHAGEQLFHTGWFVESLATQTLVLSSFEPWAIPFGAVRVGR